MCTPPPPQIMVCVTAPAVRVAIGEEVGLAPGTASEGQMVSAQRQLGFDYVFGGRPRRRRRRRCCSCGGGACAGGSLVLASCAAPAQPPGADGCPGGPTMQMSISPRI